MSEENKTSAAEEGMKPLRLNKLPDLKSLREEQGLTIEDIFLKTRINPDFLNAIENREFHLLPAPLYAKKFIELYAESIGTDAGIILAHYQRYLNEKQAVLEEVEALQAPIVHERKPFKRYLLYLIPVAIIAIAFIIYSFLREQGPDGVIQPKVTVEERKEVTPQPPAPAVKEQPLQAVDNAPKIPPAAIPKEATPIPSTAPQAPPPAAIKKEAAQTPTNAQLSLLIEATEDTWLGIKADNKPPFQVTLKTGEKLSRTAREYFIVDVGNAAGVNVTFQGKSLGKLGPKGQVVHLRLPQQ